jgi:hypothetical protein
MLDTDRLAILIQPSERSPRPTDLRNSPSCRVTFEALVEGLQRHVD